MNVESRRDLQLLEALQHESTLSQRTLASRLGIAVGLTNLYLKRLVRKGHVKCVTVTPHRLVYLVTPRGLARKARLTYEFMKYSLDYYRHARRHLRSALSTIVAGHTRVALYGTGEAAELVFLLLKEMGVDPVAVFDAAGGGRFLGFPVRAIAEHAYVGYDLVVVAVLERPAALRKRLVAAGLPPEKLLLLQTKRSVASAGSEGTVTGKIA